MDLGFVLQNLRLEHRTSQRHRYIVIIHGIGYRVVPTYLFGFKSGIPYWIFFKGGNWCNTCIQCVLYFPPVGAIWSLGVRA